MVPSPLGTQSWVQHEYPTPSPRGVHISTNTAVGSSDTMYVGPPPACQTNAPANSAATSPSDMSLMLDVVVGDSALARKIAVPPFKEKSPRSVFVLASRPIYRFLHGRHHAGWRTQSGRKRHAHGVHLSQK